MRILPVAVCALATCAGGMASEDSFLFHLFSIKELAPPSWRVVEINSKDKPYGYYQSAGEDSGVSVTIEGTNTIGVGKGTAAAWKERVTIYVMPTNYMPVDLPSPGTPSSRSRYLGSTKHRDQIYVKDWSVQSWPNWREDIKRCFNIQTSDKTEPDLDVKMEHVEKPKNVPENIVTNAPHSQH